MSQPAVAALAPLPFELVLDDGEPLESDWHTKELSLLRQLIRQAMAEQGRTDFFTAGNVFVYYSKQQAREVAAEEKQGLGMSSGSAASIRTPPARPGSPGRRAAGCRMSSSSSCPPRQS